MGKLTDKLLGRQPSEPAPGRKGKARAGSGRQAKSTQGAARKVKAGQSSLLRPLRVFEFYNTNKTDFLYEQLSHKKKIVFDLVPLLIHIEASDLLPCRRACETSPHGVYGFEMSDRTARSFAEAFPGKPEPDLRSRASLDPTMPIKSISLIGSLGSIAQNSKSDFDYWICTEANAFKSETFPSLKEKLKAIDEWAEKFAGAEVHCFPVDLEKVRVDDFGQADSESSGTAQGKILKEEFYRTLTLVAGQVPLWWGMPPNISDDEYNRLRELANRSNRIDSARFVDLGNVYNISLGEFYGAAIWQINKTIGSPFKSVLKMALLEEYMINHGSKGLLGDELKRRLLSDENDARFLDPYVLMFDRASTYLAENNRLEDLDLLRRSLYLKSGVDLTPADHRRTDLPRKKRVMAKLVQDWSWSHKKMEHLNDYHYWSTRESQRFSNEINRFIVRTYKNVSAELNSQKDDAGLTISQRDLTVLGRKLFIFFSERNNKVASVKNVIEQPPALTSLTVQARLDEKGNKVWEAYRGLLSREVTANGEASASLLRSSPYLSDVLIWLVNNRLYDESTSINLNPGYDRLATYCTVPDLQQLFKEMREFFPSYRIAEIKEKDLLNKPRLVRMLAVINLDEPDEAGQTNQIDIIYQNNWGEIFFKGYEAPSDGLNVARDFVHKRFSDDPKGLSSGFKVFMPDRNFKPSLGAFLNKFFGGNVVV